MARLRPQGYDSGRRLTSCGSLDRASETRRIMRRSSGASHGTRPEMRIAIDLDGTICPIKKPDESYADLPTRPGAVARIRQLRAEGHYIIIQTARNMATREGNVGQVMKHVGKVTLDWLDLHGVEYDEIYFGKPNADVYIDDRAVRFSSWHDITDEFLQANARER